jgi:hypothetical protein
LTKHLACAIINNKENDKLKIIEAFDKGTNGEPVNPNEGRVVRVAHRIGTSYGKSLIRRSEAQDATMRSRLDEVKGLAVGPNRIALELIDASRKIPRDVSSKPDWHNGRIDPKTKRELSREWVEVFKSPGNHTDKAFNESAVPLVRPIGNVRLGHNGLPDDITIDVPVETVLIYCTSEVSEDGSVKPPETTININQPDRDSTDVFEYDSTEISGVQIKIGADGSVKSIKQRLNNANGDSIDSDPSHTTVNVDELLNGLLGAVIETSDAYSGLTQ